ncbi:MAG: DUF721 domain-containing protein [Candidatus Cloacimonadaceae bacterium]|jgi:hypothetical protein|nr:DUF721 domain-containing protein [Candidatus Cloacimonadota bacterium]MDY0318692.1 DUF721 domain-containing protein [Candidatus Cloacimonadaceae bacterium]HQB97937.1 DUF721 domain-containing protein [Candidatus Cloacimonadota bacterium]
MAFILADNCFQNLIYRLAGEKYSRFVSVCLSWKRIVGELLAERSYPLKLENKVLFVGVQNSTWMQELVLLKQDILAKYRQYGEELDDIIFIINSPKKRKK